MSIFKKVSERFERWRAKNLAERTVTCPAKMLFSILDMREKNGLTTDILFEYKNATYVFGVYADFADLKRNPRWYTNTDKYKEFATRDDLMENAMLDGRLIKDMDDDITILEVNGCYPDREIRTLVTDFVS